jgi:hypothetical protein
MPCVSVTLWRPPAGDAAAGGDGAAAAGGAGAALGVCVGEPVLVLVDVLRGDVSALTEVRIWHSSPLASAYGMGAAPVGGDSNWCAAACVPVCGQDLGAQILLYAAVLTPLVLRDVCLTAVCGVPAGRADDDRWAVGPDLVLKVFPTPFLGGGGGGGAASAAAPEGPAAKRARVGM